MKFIVHDSTGKIVRKGTCPANHVALQARAGEIAIEDIWKDTDDRVHRIERGERVEFTPPPAPPLPLETQRAMAYPQPSEYLDAKVKQASADPAMRAEGIGQEARYLADCLAVKAQFPKSTEKE